MVIELQQYTDCRKAFCSCNAMTIMLLGVTSRAKGVLTVLCDGYHPNILACAQACSS